MLNYAADNISTEDISAATSDIDSNTEPVAPAPAIDTTSETEQQLATEITELWVVHTDAQSIVKKTQAELKTLRQHLGERLYAMKQILAKPGRAGQWSSFLAERDISRTTADRLCSAHLKSLSPDGNGTTGSVPELTDGEIEELAKAVWKKLEKKLGTKRVVYAFLGRLIAESGVGNFRFHRGDQHGIALVDPDAALTPQTTATTTATPAAVPTNVA